jgi:hypothetical protein
MVLPEWKLAPNQPVEVQLAWGGEWSDATVADDGQTLIAQGAVVQPYGLREHPQSPDLLRPLPGGPRPTCPRGNAARPNVMMFSDGAFNSARADEQREMYYEWYETLPPDARLVVIEIGVGTAVQKVRAMAETMVQAFEHSTLVRINLGDMEHVCLGTDGLEEAGRVVSVRMGALAALQHIDKLMQNVRCER